MHYVIGLLSTVAALVYALHRLQSAGLDLNALNPFLWYRRAQWRKKYGEKPLYTLAEPVEVAAVLLLGAAKCEGELSTEQKDGLLAMFAHELRLGQAGANDMLVASSFLLRDEVYIHDHLDKVLARSLDRFSPEQRTSIVELMERAAKIGGAMNEEQGKLIARTRELLAIEAPPTTAWG
jgi:uncharacterized tellurite resistance protein B-like protein